MTYSLLLSNGKRLFSFFNKTALLIADFKAISLFLSNICAFFDVFTLVLLIVSNNLKTDSSKVDSLINPDSTPFTIFKMFSSIMPGISKS